jgi:VCBS repeat-containing protein
MLKFINLKKSTAKTLLGILATGTLISQSAMAAPVKIDSLDTTRVSATSHTGNVCDQSGANCTTKNYGTGTNIRLNGFRAGGKDYSILKLVDEAKFQRVDNSKVQGQRHIYFLEKGSNNSIGSSAIFTMENAVRSNFINGGTDNVFANNAGVNFNNIERVDFLIKSGLIVKQEYVNDAGFLLLERAGNDSFKIAAITAIDANGNPSQFGNLISLPTSTWGNSGIPIITDVFQNQSNWNAPKLTASVGSQNIHGIFISISSLGIASGQTVYGYALFPGDINSSNDLVSLSDFPKNTSDSSGNGGLDLISSGGLFIPKNVPESAVFQPASAVNDTVTTNEDTSVNGNVLTNDIGDGLTVTSTGQQTLTSGATVNINSNGTFTYNPNSKFESLNTGDTKPDTFSYTMKDGSNNSSSAIVTMIINGAADNPVATNDSVRTDEDTVTSISVLQNDSDPNTARENLTITKIENQSIAVNGLVTLNSGATIELLEVTDSSKHSTQGKYILKYDPRPSASLNSLNTGSTGTDTFTYTVSDPQGNAGDPQGNVTITVDGITDNFD